MNVSFEDAIPGRIIFEKKIDQILLARCLP